MPAALPVPRPEDTDADLPALMAHAAAQFCDRIARNAAEAPPPRLPPHDARLLWHNRIFTAAQFRRAHVERFEHDGHFAVLHVCIFPHLTDAAPIFGFDMIAGRDVATGIFLDFSPAVPDGPNVALRDIIPPSARARFRARPAPEGWGSIFSPDFFAIRPASRGDVTAALALAGTALDAYLECLGGGACGDPRAAAGQASYARGQRQNPHTLRMLARFVGAESARHFIDEVLFPLPETPAPASRLYTL